MPDHPYLSHLLEWFSFIERLEQVELLARVEHAFACNILNRAKRLNVWNVWNGLIPW
jgi:hypothetical protein